MLIGLALRGLDLLSSSHGGVVRSGANTLKLNVDLLNKGTTIERPLEGDIFGFKLYACRGATLDGAQVSDHITLFADASCWRDWKTYNAYTVNWCLTGGLTMLKHC